MNLVQVDINHDYTIQQESNKTVIYTSESVSDYYFNSQDGAVSTEPLSSIFIKIWLGTRVCNAAL